jgi:hypothetical protein
MTKVTVQGRFMSKFHPGVQKNRRPYPGGVFFDQQDRSYSIVAPPILIL